MSDQYFVFNFKKCISMYNSLLIFNFLIYSNENKEQIFSISVFRLHITYFH